MVLACSAAAQLGISNVDFSSQDKSSEVKPNEFATISFDIDNDGDGKIENIKTKIHFERDGKKMQDDTGDDIEFKPETIDYIKEGKSKSMELSFHTPFDVRDGDEWTVVVYAEGKNASNNAKFTDEDRSESFTITRDRHDLLFYKLDISPTSISCERMLTLHYDIRNIGEQDEKGNLTIINDVLGINYSSSYDLDSNYDEDNKFEDTQTFQLKNTLPVGTYGLTLMLNYDDNLKTKYNTTQITVQECNGQTAGTTTGTGTETTGTGTQTGQIVDVQYTQPTQPSTTYYSAAPPKKSEGISQTTLLVVAGVVILALFITVIVLVMRKR